MKNTEKKIRDEYYNEENLVDLINDIEEEIQRVKEMVNSKGYHHGTAFNSIVRRYRTELKNYHLLVRRDLTDLREEDETRD